MGTKATHHMPDAGALVPLAKPVPIPDLPPAVQAAQEASLTSAQKAKLPKPPSIASMRKNLAKNMPKLLGQ